jgi:transcriptional regulator with XRE-family HTH domain
MSRRTLKDLDAVIGPRRVAKSKTNARKEAMLLSEVRKQLGFTQSAVANAMGVTQSALSQVEAQNDMQLSTLRRLVKVLGGELDIVARFGDRRVILVNERNDRKKSPHRESARRLRGSRRVVGQR